MPNVDAPLLLHIQESEEWDHWIKDAFAAFDHDGSGRLSTEALNEMLCGEVCVVGIPVALFCFSAPRCPCSVC